MSIESEKGKNINIEIPVNIPRHTHNGLDSEKISLLDIQKKLLKKGSYFLGELGDGLPINISPPLYTPNISYVQNEDSNGDTYEHVNLSELNQYLESIRLWLEEIRSRDMIIRDILLKNRFGTVDEQPNYNIYHFDK